MTFDEWSARWHLPAAALADLATVQWESAPPAADGSEAAVQANVRLKAATMDGHLWRNNVGALRTEGGAYVRFGLANDSPKLNAVLKSHDLVGWRRRLIAPADVGSIIGQFWSVEVKPPNWRQSSDKRYPGQSRWGALVERNGGLSQFVTDASQLK